MICSVNKLWIKDPHKQTTKSGKTFWRFYVSLGKYDRGIFKGQWKGTLNFVYFGKQELKDNMAIANCKFDLVTEVVNGKTYYKAIVDKGDFETHSTDSLSVSENPKKNDEIVNVEDYFANGWYTPMGTKKEEEPTGIDKDLEELIYNDNNGKENN